MVQHKQPTKEELKAAEDAAIAEVEKLEKEPPKEEESEEEPKEEDEAPKVDDTPVEEGEKEEEPVAEEDQATPSKEIVRLKKENTSSSRENQKIYAKNRVINQALVQADELPEPTEEQLTKEYPDWELMSDVEKTLAKETVISRNWRKVISEAKEQATKIEKWNDSVDEFVSDPKTLIDIPELDGKTDEFKDFATLEENNSVPFKTLVGAFLYNQSTKKVQHKGEMFPRALGGQKDKPQPNDGSIGLEEARRLRETDYNKWKEMLTAGKIKSDL